MDVLIVAATQQEISPLLEKINLRAHIGLLHRLDFSYQSLSLTFVITGIGMVNTAMYMSRYMAKRKYYKVINLGLCGSFDKNIPIGEVLNVTEDIFSEMGAEDGENFLTINEMGFNFESNIRSDTTAKNKCIDKLRKVKGITVNTVHGNTQSIERVQHKFSPDVESMEGAAFLLTCKKFHVTAGYQVRAVSNYVERRNKDNWNIPLAIENLNKKALEILDSF